MDSLPPERDMWHDFIRRQPSDPSPELVERDSTGFDVPVPGGQARARHRDFEPLLTVGERRGALLHPALQLFIGLLQCLLRQFLRRDVGGHAGHTKNLSFLVPDREGPVPNPANRSVRSHDPILFVIDPGRLFGDGSLENSRSILRMNGLEPRAGRRVEALARSSPDRFISRTDIEDGILGRVAEPKDLLNMFGHLPELLLSLPQSRLYLPALRHIHRDSADQRQDPFFINDGEFAHQAFMRSVPVRSRLGREEGALRRNNLRIVGLKLRGNCARQDIAIGLASPVVQTNLKSLLECLIEVDVSPLHVFDPGKSR